MNIISLHGESNCGKDTIAAALVDKLYGYGHYKFGEFLRQEVYNFLQLDDRFTDEQERTVIVSGQTIKEWMVTKAPQNTDDPYRLCRKMYQLVQERKSGLAGLIVSDCRKPCELATLKQLGRVSKFRLMRSGSYSMPLDHLLDDVPMNEINNDNGTPDQVADRILTIIDRQFRAELNMSKIWRWCND